MKKRRLVAIMMAGVMALSMIPGFGAAAADPVDVEVKLKKSLRMDAAIDAPPVSSFKFDITAVTEGAPTLDPITILYDGNETNQREEDESNQGHSVIVHYYDKEANLTISNNKLTGDDFDHAGLYEYTVKEAEDSTYTSVANKEGLTDSMTFSKAEYTLKILVANDDTTGSLYIADVGYTKTTDDAGNEVNNPSKSGEMVFVNEYEKDSDNGGDPDDPDDKDTSLSVKKVIDGEYADKSQTFNFEITLWPNATTKETICKGKIYKAEGGIEDVEVTYGQKQTFKLGHNDELRFSYLPVGAQYNVTETTVPNYTATVSGIVGGKTITNQSLTEFVKNYTAGDKKDDRITVTNTYSDIPETGITTDVLPFVILMVVAVAGMMVYAVVRRRFRA